MLPGPAAMRSATSFWIMPVQQGISSLFSNKPILGKECPLTEDALFNKRPEQLSVQEFINLTNSVEKALKKMDR